MFFIDDVVLSPFKGFLFIAKEVAKAVDQAREGERASAMKELSMLHQKLEAGEITDEEFDERESELLDLLESQET